MTTGANMTTDEINRELTHASWRAARPLVLALALVGLCIWAALAKAGGTVTKSTSIVLQRSATTLTATTTPKLACPVTTRAECEACALAMYTAEIKIRTTGYVTYQCLDSSKFLVKFNTTPVPPVVVPPPPVASLQVYTCADAGADGRILESDAISWPNCSAVSYRNPDRSLVVATNTGTRPLYWRLASKATGRVWTQTGTTGNWVTVGDINWGTTPTLGTADIRWTPPTQKVDGTPLDNLAGHRIVYGTSASALTKTIDITTPSITSYVIEQLPPATYYFAVKAYNTSGGESGLGPIAVKAIP
jgi:hypothetical protein